MLCDYGCGKKAEFTLKNGKNCCAKRPAGCEVLKKINSERTKAAHDEGRHGYTWNVNSAWSKGKSLTTNKEIFTENSRYSNEFVKQRIVKDNLFEYRCSKCGIDSWQGETIVLDLDHVNGVNTDNRLNNLRYLAHFRKHLGPDDDTKYANADSVIEANAFVQNEGVAQ